jgi:DnaK suppressor protein
MDLDTQTHLHWLRESLVLRLDELRSDLQAAAQARRAEPAGAAHEVADRKDLAEQRASSDIAEESERRDLDELRLVEAALRRLGEGSYGDCEDCGDPIGWHRLQVQPAAPRCAACQALRERVSSQAERLRRR